MPGSSFGQAFRITTAGESHGPANLVIIDGCPPGLALAEADFEEDLGRRRPGQSGIVSQRKEADRVEILSGVFEGRTTGTCIAILVRNEDQRGRDYEDIKDKYRPGHADFTYDAKYGFRDYRGGGRASARETVARVAAGVVAKRVIGAAFGGSVVAYVKQVGDVVAEVPRPEQVSLESVERLPSGKPNVTRCPDPEKAGEMLELIDSVRRSKDSVGGVAEVVAKDVPAGLGEPVFDKLKADLGKALLSVPGVVGVELGSGFAAARMRGSEHNDAFYLEGTRLSLISLGEPEVEAPRIATRTNRHGGILGGISSGMPIVMRAALKPPSSLPVEQETVTAGGRSTTITTKGRHDPCVVPRFVPVAEAMVAIVLADHWLRWQGGPPRPSA